MSRRTLEILEVNPDQLQAVVRRAEQSLEKRDAELIRAVFESYEYVAELIQDKNTSIRRLRQLYFGAKTEKTDAVVGNTADSAEGKASGGGNDAAGEDSQEPGPDPAEAAPAENGHGRTSAAAYRGAEQIEIPHQTLQAGDTCPECQQGTVYEKSPAVMVRISGQAPLQARVYHLQKLRCHLCGQVFTAELPGEAGTQKYDATAASMIALLKYGSGMPFNRVEGAAAEPGDSSAGLDSVGCGACLRSRDHSGV